MLGISFYSMSTSRNGIECSEESLASPLDRSMTKIDPRCNPYLLPVICVIN